MSSNIVIFPFSPSSIQGEISFLNTVVESKPGSSEIISQIYEKAFKENPGAERAYLTLAESVTNFQKEQEEVEELTKDPRFQKPFCYNRSIPRTIVFLAQEQLAIAKESLSTYEETFKMLRCNDLAHQWAQFMYSMKLDLKEIDRRDQLEKEKLNIIIQNDLADRILSDLLGELACHLSQGK